MKPFPYVCFPDDVSHQDCSQARKEDSVSAYTLLSESNSEPSDTYGQRRDHRSTNTTLWLSRERPMREALFESLVTK
jgi:hypothetical protein